MRRRASRAIVAVCALLASLATAEEPDVRDLHRRYMEASIRHDLKVLRSLMADDIVWNLGPYSFTGKDEALAPHAYDAGAATELEYRDVVIRDNIVEFELVERGPVLQAVGLPELVHRPRFVYRDGLLVRKEPSQPSPVLRRLSEHLQPLMRWVRENRPAAREELLGPQGEFTFSEANGVLMRTLAEEWVQAGAPGRLTRR